MPLGNELREPSLDQLLKNHIKVARAAIRLKHSIQADNELEQIIPELRKTIARQMSEGYVDGMTTADMLRLVEGR